MAIHLHNNWKCVQGSTQLHPRPAQDAGAVIRFYGYAIRYGRAGARKPAGKPGKASLILELPRFAILMLTVICLLVCLLCMYCSTLASTEFDNSLKPAAEIVTGSKTQKSVADIVAKATGKLDKTKAKQTATKKEASSKRKCSLPTFRFIAERVEN
jgi:hypothetical protein